jgi:hypothetical protein
MKCVLEMVFGGMIYLPSFMKIGSAIEIISRLLPKEFDRVQCWYYWWKGFINYTTEMVSCGMIYIFSFMKIETGVQAILRSCLSNFRSCNIGITDGRDL